MYWQAVKIDKLLKQVKLSLVCSIIASFCSRLTEFADMCHFWESLTKGEL